tara:strand:- start:386 stop:694 length:309 start_codon:yes stop_codon:yes gene_type:complete
MINKIIELLGVLLFSITLSPQIIKIIKTQQVNDISIWFLILNLFSSFFLGYSAIINNNTQFIIVNTVSIVQTCILLTLKKLYENNPEICFKHEYKTIPDEHI